MCLQNRRKLPPFSSRVSAGEIPLPLEDFFYPLLALLPHIHNYGTYSLPAAFLFFNPFRNINHTLSEMPIIVFGNLLMRACGTFSEICTHLHTPILCFLYLPSNLTRQTFIFLCQNRFKGTITSHFDHVADNYSVVASPLYDTGYEEGPYQGIAFADPSHAEILRQKTADHHNITLEGCRPGKSYPVIRILNREISSNRSLLNAETLKRELSNMTDVPIDISFFEGKGFVEQIQFMMETDILISPHGAQLTSVNFIPSCGGVVELFPQGFWFPHFFGPLATSSGLFHAYIYTGVNHIKEWKWGGLRHRWKRFEVRNQQVCLSLEHSLPIIDHMIQNWKHCCHDKLQQEGF
jgi:hypothetical protein